MNILPHAICALAIPALLPAAEPRPDVLVVLTDQWNPRYVGWDHPDVRTPHLDRIALEGMIFDRCYTTSPVCMPARVSLITGLYPHNEGHALWGNALEYAVSPDAAPMFRDVRQAGYTTAQIGKLHWSAGPAWKRAYPTIAEYHAALGLEHVVDIPGPPDSDKARDPYSQHLRTTGALATVAGDIRRRLLDWEYEPRPSAVDPQNYHDSFVTGLAADFIRAQPKDRPMCLVVSLHSPHPPLDAPGEFAKMYDPERLALPANVPESFSRDGRTIDRSELRRLLANYLGKIALVDQCVGRLESAMRERGSWERALVIVTADHGEMMGAHGALSKGRFYEESARVPLVVRWPGRVRPGRTRALVQMMDLYPTIVEALGGKLSPGRFARSLLPVATGRLPSIRDLVISEIAHRSQTRMMARDERFKYWVDERGESLFDLETDPLESNDLAASAESQRTLDAMRRCLLDELRSTQVNRAEGYRGKVQRLRETERGAHPTPAPPTPP